jgi:UDP-glucose 4-epimerase
MKVLVVGARGFIGSALVEKLLRHDAHVTCVTRGALPTQTQSRAEWFRVDHMSQQSWNDIISEHFDIIYHLGWSTIPRTAESDPVMDLVENVATGLRILVGIKQTSPQTRLIFSSSGGTIYGRTNQEFVSEDHPLRPISAYGVGKLAFEQYLALYRSEYLVEGICTRLSNPYGPDQHTNRSFGAVSTFLRMALDNKKISIYGSGHITRDYIYISDVCDALYKLAIVDNPPDYVNIGSGQGSSLLDIVATLEDLLGRPVDYEVVDGRSFDLQRIVLDTSSLKRAISWGSPISLKEGIEKMMMARGPALRVDAQGQSGQRVA